MRPPRAREAAADARQILFAGVILFRGRLRQGEAELQPQRRPRGASWRRALASGEAAVLLLLYLRQTTQARPPAPVKENHVLAREAKLLYVELAGSKRRALERPARQHGSRDNVAPPRAALRVAGSTRSRRGQPRLDRHTLPAQRPAHHCRVIAAQIRRQPSRRLRRRAARRARSTRSVGAAAPALGHKAHRSAPGRATPFAATMNRMLKEQKERSRNKKGLNLGNGKPRTIQERVEELEDKQSAPAERQSGI